MPDPKKSREQKETKREEMNEEVHDIEDTEEEKLYEEDWNSDESD